MDNPYARQIVDEARRDRKGAAEKIGQLAGVKAAREILLDLLQHAKFADLRIAAAEALGAFGDDKAVAEELIRVLEGDKVWHVRNATIRALARIGSPAAIAAIQRALNDRAYGVREDARQVLESFGATVQEHRVR